jgi:pseudouridine-5'-phosphate glycosidase
VRSLADVLRVGDEVRDALATNVAVVALESTIFSRLGLPLPASGEALDRCTAAIRAAGAVPAVTAVLDGVPVVGLAAGEHARLFEADPRKAAARDVPVAVAQRWRFGATTVSASVMLAAAASIPVFATGGIGGVHRGAETTGDTSADLGALAAHPVVVVSAGAKAFLDLGRTLEWLDTAGVPVVGWQTSEFPAFYSRSSGLPVPHRVEGAAEVVDVFRAGAALGWRGGVLVAAPIPAAAEIPWADVSAAIEHALADAAAARLAGPAVTPFVLGAIAVATGGRSVPANLALAEHNAAVAAEIAVAFADGPARESAG